MLREILGHDVDVPTGYGRVRMHCPFHPDRTPSATINHDDGWFNCHSCGRKGDALKLLETELGLDFKDALERARSLEAGTSSVVGRGPSRRRRRASDLLGRG